MQNRSRPAIERMPFPPRRDFKTLSIRELVLAREAWQVPLSNMRNVIGTAIGLYRFRAEDKDRVETRSDSSPVRTLSNSEVRQSSYPCVLVLVTEWAELQLLTRGASGLTPYDVVPPFLYTRDGLAVPTCVIKVDLDEAPSASVGLSERSFPRNLLGGGCPLVTQVQGVRHAGTAACLVTDGERTYVLSARHATGPAGQEVYSIAGGRSQRIGAVSDKQVVGRAFSEMYPTWEVDRTVTTLDAGLVEIDRADLWTSQVFGLGELNPPANLNCANLTLGLLGTPVKAYGARSGLIEGEIQGLFPRHKSVAGVEFVSDLLIGPRKDRPFTVGYGDSGTLFVVDDGHAARSEAPRYTPVALNWGALLLTGEAGSSGFALGSLLSNVCVSLGVDLQTGHNTGFTPIWGKVKHESFANILCDSMEAVDSTVSSLLLDDGQATQELREIFLGLSYVPDDWKRGKVRLPGYGDRAYGRGGEGPNHYANVDLTADGEVLADIAAEPKAWLDFYRRSDDKKNRGALPFRIGQVYREMRGQLGRGEYDEFACAAGVLMHYCADACNPAHVTRWGRGDPSWDGGDGPSDFHHIWDYANYDFAWTTDALVNALPSVDVYPVEAPDIERDAVDLMVRVQRRVPLGQFTEGETPTDACEAAAKYLKRSSAQRKVAECVVEGCVFWWKLVATALHFADQTALAGASWTKTGSNMGRIAKRKTFLKSIALKYLAGES